MTVEQWPWDDPGPKFTNNFKTIDSFRTYDNLMTSGEFTEHLRKS